MVETIFDTLNAKAALFAIGEVFEHRGGGRPVTAVQRAVRLRLLLRREDLALDVRMQTSEPFVVERAPDRQMSA